MEENWSEYKANYDPTFRIYVDSRLKDDDTCVLSLCVYGYAAMLMYCVHMYVICRFVSCVEAR